MHTIYTLITLLPDLTLYLQTHLIHHLPTIKRVATSDVPPLVEWFAWVALAAAAVLGPVTAVAVVALLFGQEQWLLAAWHWTWGEASPTLARVLALISPFTTLYGLLSKLRPKR